MTLEVKPNSRDNYEFGLAPIMAQTETKVGEREFHAKLFNAQQVLRGKKIRIDVKYNQTIITLITADDKEHVLNMTRQKCFQDAERISAKNWLNWIVPGNLDFLKISRVKFVLRSA